MDKLLVRELIDTLEAEINNGGFDQFFFNSAGDRTAETIEALRNIGALRTAAVVARASAKFPSGQAPSSRDSRQKELEKISPNCDAFAAEDSEFLAYEDDLGTLVGAHA